MEIGTVVSSLDGPSPTTFSFVVKEEGSKVRRGQFVELETAEGRLIARIRDIIKTNRYFEREESVREYERKGEKMDSIFPVGRWEFTVAEAKPLGIYFDHSLMQKPSFPPSPGTKVYLAQDENLSRFLGLDKKGLHLGTIEHHDIPVKLNMTRLLQKHVAILAMSGAGKSYMTSVLLEELIGRAKDEGRIGIVLIDVHGEYSSFADPVKQGKACTDYSSRSKMIKGTDVKIAVPNLTAPELCRFLSGITPVQERELDRILRGFYKKYKQGEGTYNLWDIVKTINADEKLSEKTKDALGGWLSILNKQGLFADVDYPAIKSLVKPGHLSVIDLSAITGLRTKQIIVTYLMMKLFEMRKNEQIPPFLVVLEEAHQFVPEGTKSEYALSKSIIETIAREGRKFHASLCLISQRPIRLSTTVLSQCNTHIILRVTNPYDLDHIGRSSEGITKDTLDTISALPVGEGLIVGEAVNYPIFVRIRQRKSQESTKGIELERAALAFEEKKASKEKDAESFM